MLMICEVWWWVMMRMRMCEGGEGGRGAREDGLKFKVGGDDETRLMRGVSVSVLGGVCEVVVVGM